MINEDNNFGDNFKIPESKLVKGLNNLCYCTDNCKPDYLALSKSSSKCDCVNSGLLKRKRMQTRILQMHVFDSSEYWFKKVYGIGCLSKHLHYLSDRSKH